MLVDAKRRWSAVILQLYSQRALAFYQEEDGERKLKINLNNHMHPMSSIQNRKN